MTWRSVRIVMLMILTGVLVATAAGAETEEDLSPAALKGWAVSGFRVEGLDKDLASGLTRGLILSGEARLIGTRYPRFYPNLLEADLARARLYLARQGYPRARVTSRLLPHPAAKKVEVTLVVAAGAPVLVASVTVSGAPADIAPAVGRALVLRENTVFSEARLDQSVHGAVSALQEAGYARAAVRTEVTPLDSTAVTLRLIAEPGSRYVFGRTAVEGAAPDLVDLVRKTVAITPGDRYSPSALRRAQDSLRLLGLFRQALVETRAVGADTLEVVAKLAPRDPRSLETGIGYWTDDQFRAHAQWAHRNFFRAGRGVDLSGSYSRYQQDVAGRFWWPALFGSRTRAQISAGLTRESEESYDLTNAELELSAHYRYSFQTTLQAAVTLADVNVTAKTDDPDAFLEKGGVLTVLSVGWNRETADDRLYPRRGALSWLRVEWSPAGALSDNPYLLGEVFQSVYLPLPGDMVSASRVAVGLAKPLGGSLDLLPNERFYAGGASSNRGFKRRRLGPLDQDGNPIGGEAMLEISTEIRFPLFWRFRGVLFTDAAQAWSRPSDMGLMDLAVAAGPGLMLRTPIGPVRADVGTRFGTAAGDPPRTVFHLTIGNPF